MKRIEVLAKRVADWVVKIPESRMKLERQQDCPEELELLYRLLILDRYAAKSILSVEPGCCSLCIPFSLRLLLVQLPSERAPDDLDD